MDLFILTEVTNNNLDETPCSTSRDFTSRYTGKIYGDSSWCILANFFDKVPCTLLHKTSKKTVYCYNLFYVHRDISYCSLPISYVQKLQHTRIRPLWQVQMYLRLIMHCMGGIVGPRHGATMNIKISAVIEPRFIPYPTRRILLYWLLYLCWFPHFTLQLSKQY